MSSLLCWKTSTKAGQNVGQRIINSLGTEIETSGGIASIGASIGVAFILMMGDEAELLKAADQAMYNVKKSGKGAVAFVEDTDSPPV